MKRRHFKWAFRLSRKPILKNKMHVFEFKIFYTSGNLLYILVKYTCKRPTASNNLRNRAIYSQISVKIKSLSLFGFPEFCDIPVGFLVYWNSILLKIRNSNTIISQVLKRTLATTVGKFILQRISWLVSAFLELLLVLILVDILLLNSPLLGSLPLHPPVLEPHLHLKPRKIKI